MNRGTPPPKIQSGINYNQIDPVGTIPETILIECSRNTAPSLDNGLNSDPATWTCNFDGGIQLKKGDAISINSATLNSVGVGSLINFTLDNSNNDQDNKCCFIHSFYVVNDGKNNKRESINIDPATFGEAGIFRWDTTNNDCDLYRWENVGSETNISNRSVSFFQDKFLPLRVNTTDVKIEPYTNNVSLNDISYIISIRLDSDNDNVNTKPFSYFSVHPVAPDGTIGASVDLFNNQFLQIGRNYATIPVSIPSLNTPNQYYDPFAKGIFGVCGVFQNVGNNIIEAPDGYYYRITSLNPIWFGSDNIRQTFTNISVNFAHVCGEVNFNDDYGYTSVFYNWEDQLFNQGDIVYNIEYNQIDYNIQKDNKFVDDLKSNGSVATGIITSSNVETIDIDILQMFGGNNWNFPVQGFINSFIFKLKGITFDTINDLITYNENYYQFGLRIYTETGYSYITLIIGGSDDNSTITNKNIVEVYSNIRGCRAYTNINQKQISDGEFISISSDVPVPVNSDSNPHQLLFIGRLTNSVDIRYWNDVKQSFFGNYSGNANLRGLNQTAEAYWVKESMGDTNRTLYAYDTSVFNPVHIENYTGGIMRSFNFYNEDNATIVSQFTPQDAYIQHYEYFNLQINSKWNSPSDIATELTDQTHAIDDARTQYGDIIPNSAGKGIPHNRLCIPIFTTSASSEYELITDQNLQYGSMKLKDTYTNVGVSPPYKGDGNLQEFSGEVDIFFRTINTSINYPSSIDRNGNKTTQLPPDFNQSAGIMGNDNYIRTASSYDETGKANGFPLQYIEGQDAYISQFAGANDISFGWDDNISRFSIGNLHVGIYSLFQEDISTGGSDEVKIYVPAIPYKKNQVRSGGIYIQNFNSTEMEIGMGLKKILENCEKEYTFNFTPTWFLSDDNRDIIGKRFWNKLGFDDSQIGSNGSLVGVSTQNEVDTAVAIVPSAEPASNRPAYKDLGNFADQSTGGDATEATYVYSSYGNMNMNNHSVGMGGIPNTQGSPLEYKPNVKPSAGLNKTGITTLTADEANDIINSECNFNPDREFHTYYTISTRDDMTTTLDALNLPVKTRFSYFYILSDLVETNFYSSKNGGMPINCVGIINKLNSDNDFYFSYSSPQRFYITKDRVVSSITTSIRNVDYSSPALISDYSSVIYQIDRYNPIPSTIPMSIPENQEIYFDNLTNLVDNVLKESDLPDDAKVVEEVLEQLYIGGLPTQNTQQIVNDVIQTGTEIKAQEAVSAPAPEAKGTGGRVPVYRNISEVPVREIYKNFLSNRIYQGLGRRPITKDDLTNYLNEFNFTQKQRDEALKNWRRLNEMRLGAIQEQRSVGRVNEELLERYRRGGADLRRRTRPPPAYLLPPEFDEEGIDVPDEE